MLRRLTANRAETLVAVEATNDITVFGPSRCCPTYVGRLMRQDWYTV